MAGDNYSKYDDRLIVEDEGSRRKATASDSNAWVPDDDVPVLGNIGGGTAQNGHSVPVAPGAYPTASSIADDSSAILTDGHKKKSAGHGCGALPGAYAERSSSSRHAKSQDQIKGIHTLRLEQECRKLGREEMLRDAYTPNASSAYQDSLPIDNLHKQMMEEAMLQEICDREDASKRRRLRMRLYLGICLVVAGALVIVTVVLVVITSNSNDAGTIDQPTLPPIKDHTSQQLHLTACFQTDHPETNSLYNLIHTVISSSFDNYTIEDVPGSKTRASLCWLTYYDEFEGKLNDLHQRFLLSSIYFHFVGVDLSRSPIFVASNWLDPISVCDWDNIQCSDDSANVSELMFPAMDLEGSLPVEVTALSSLARLYIRPNFLSGTIPDQLYGLTSLKMLGIDTTRLTGTLSESILSLTNLQELYLATNEGLHGSIPDLGKLTELRTIVMIRNTQLTGSFPDMTRLVHLERLVFASTPIGGTISSTIGSLKNLRLLRLDGTKFSGSLPTELGRLSKLEEIAVVGNRFSGTIPSQLGLLAQLKYFQISRCLNLSGSVPEEVCSLRRNAILEEVVADACMDCLCCSQCDPTGCFAETADFPCQVMLPDSFAGRF